MFLVPLATAWVLPLQLQGSNLKGRSGMTRCCATEPETNDQQSIPPERLADAWRRDEQAAELVELLQGCPLYLIGVGARKNAVGKVLSRRLTRYRYYEVVALLLSTYKTMAGKSEDVSLQNLLSSESLTDVEMLSSAVLQQVQAYSRSVIVPWEGAVSRSDFMVMQQGIVIRITSEDEGEVALPEENADETLQKWRDAHALADVTIALEDGVPADDAVAQVVDGVLKFISANPAKNAEWKAKAEASLAKEE